jgi:hypothetical protein
MENNVKDLMLADYLDGKIARQQLLGQFPDAEEELELLDLSIQALSSLPLLKTNKQTNTPTSLPLINLKKKKYWYAAASVILITITAAFFFLSHKKDNINFSAHLESNQTEEKLIALAEILQSATSADKYQQQLLQLSTKDRNSNIRYMALEKLVQLPVHLSDAELTDYINAEQIFTNQTVWLELWIKIHPTANSTLLQWLNKEDINPAVKNYGVSLLKATVKL